MKIFTCSVLVLLFSCTNEQRQHEGSLASSQESHQDSAYTHLSGSFPEGRIGEPFQVAEIDQLEFTSGGGKGIEKHIQCDSAQTGFYGSYFLIDRQYADEVGRPIGGTITIHSDGNMADWKSTDTDQIICRIHLKSDIIAVWDSITIGMTRSEIEQFGEANGGFCVQKGEAHYSCDFYNFSAVFQFQQDSLKEIIVTRNCETHP